MPDIDHLDQCQMLAKSLWFLPAPVRGEIASGLYSLGVRVHPELATKEVQLQGPAGLGEHRLPRLVNITTTRLRQDGMAIIRQFDPELAAKIDAAETERQKQELLAEIRDRYPEAIAQAQAQLSKVAMEDLP
ncbi:MAG: hypothetical protein K2Q25_11890 [Mycobacteriaceae bacterium]|nr:hypothetical protein [Mycobacteriaceae bacterium]